MENNQPLCELFRWNFWYRKATVSTGIDSPYRTRTLAPRGNEHSSNILQSTKVFENGNCSDSDRIRISRPRAIASWVSRASRRKRYLIIHVFCSSFQIKKSQKKFEKKLKIQIIKYYETKAQFFPVGHHIYYLPCFNRNNLQQQQHADSERRSTNFFFVRKESAMRYTNNIVPNKLCQE